jgi:hypothetical protein
MEFYNKQDIINIEFSKFVKKVGIKLSGGIDSAIVCYMLAIYVKEERPDTVIHPISCIAENKPFQEVYAKRVMNKITELTGVEFGEHFIGTIRTDTANNYIGDMRDIVIDLYNQGKIQAHFVGLTANPSKKKAPELYDGKHNYDKDRKRKKHHKKPQRYGGRSFRPLINIDKRGVRDLYKSLGVLDSLLPETRSCETFTKDWSVICEDCWSCREKHWGFGHY